MIHSGTDDAGETRDRSDRRKGFHAPTNSSPRVRKCVEPVQCFNVPKTCSTVRLRTVIASGRLSRRFCAASTTGSCSQREMRGQPLSKAIWSADSLRQALRRDCARIHWSLAEYQDGTLEARGWPPARAPAWRSTCALARKALHCPARAIDCTKAMSRCPSGTSSTRRSRGASSSALDSVPHRMNFAPHAMNSTPSEIHRLPGGIHSTSTAIDSTLHAMNVR
jgi:hypothetical protein